MSRLKLVFIVSLLLLATVLFAQDDAEKINMQVVATKTQNRIEDTSADVTVITSEDLETRTGDTAADVLRDFGVVITEEAALGRAEGARPTLRGFDFSNVLVIIDGQRIALDSGTGFYTLKRLPASSIERIEVLKGPSSFLYGSDAMGGVIHITTKKGSGKKGFSGSAGASYGNNFKGEDDAHNTEEYFNLSYGFENGNSIYFGGNFEYANSFISEYTPQYDTTTMTVGNVPNEIGDFINFGINGGGVISIGDIQSLSISAFYNQEESSIREITPGLTNNSKEFIGNIAYEIFPTDNVDVRISTGLNYYNLRQLLPGDLDFDNHFIYNTTEIFTAWYINDIFTLKGGYNLDVEFLDYANKGAGTRLKVNQIGNALFVGGDADIDTDINFDIDMTLGARYQVTTTSTEDYDGDEPIAHSVSPEFGIVLKPVVEWLAVKGHVGNAFNSPTVSEVFGQIIPAPTQGPAGLVYFASNPDLVPESSWSYSGTIEVYPIKELVISASVFRSDIKNLIELVVDGTHTGGNGTLELYTHKNIGKAVYYGYDIGSSLSIEAGNAGVFGYGFNFEQLWAYNTTEEVTFTDGSKGYARLDRPEYTISANISWMHQQWGTLIRLSGNYYALGYEYDMTTLFTTGQYEEKRTKNVYTTLDIRLSQDILAFVDNAPETIVWLDIKNLLNTQIDDDDDGDYDNEGINFKVGFDIIF